MSQPNSALPDFEDTGQPTSLTSSADNATSDELDTLLARAAEHAAAKGVDSDTFIRAAWAAFLDARPGLREALEDKHLKSELRKLRKRGLVGLA
jgi:hypothetical protein